MEKIITPQPVIYTEKFIFEMNRYYMAYTKDKFMSLHPTNAEEMEAIIKNSQAETEIMIMDVTPVIEYLQRPQPLSDIGMVIGSIESVKGEADQFQNIKKKTRIACSGQDNSIQLDPKKWCCLSGCNQQEQPVDFPASSLPHSRSPYSYSKPQATRHMTMVTELIAPSL
jgi:hypothetical protein